MQEKDRFIPPDKRLRRLAIAVAILLCGAGGVGLWWLAASLEGIESLEGEALQAAIVEGVEMHRHERRARMAGLRDQVRRMDVQGWADRFLAELAR